MTPSGRTAPHAEDGFALIEVLVSALILAIVAAGVMALLQATTRSAATERRHAEAYAIAQEDQARMRSMRLSSLNRLEQTRPVTLDGNEFTVESKGVFIDNTKGQPSACTSGETSADYVRITSTVDWPDGNAPVTIQSIVSPSNGSLDPNHGTLVITTKNAAGEALPTVGLSATGAGSFSGTTDSTGCANFTDLPAGNYEVTPNTSGGLVDVHGESGAAQKTSVIAAGTNTLPLQFDYGATLPLRFEYRVGSLNEFKPAKVDAAYVFNVLMNPAHAYWTTGKTRQEEIVATPIFPFTSPDTVYAGACEVNNPKSGEGVGSVTLEPGKTAPTMTLKVPALELTVKNGSTALKGATVKITDEECKVNGSYLTREYTTESAGHQSSANNGVAEYGLPYGKYEICASSSISGTNRRVRVSGLKVQNYSSATTQSIDLSSGEKNKTC